MYWYNVKWCQFLQWLLLLIQIVNTTNSGRTRFNHIEETLGNLSIAEKLKLLEPIKLLKNYQISNTNINISVNTCSQDILIYLLGVQKRKLWALKMIDSSSRIPSGILQGNIIDLGIFNECMETRGKLMESEIQGRHCIYTIEPAFDYATNPFIKPTLSICVPHTCTSDNIIDMVNKTINVTDKLKDAGVKVVDAYCTSIGPKTLDKISNFSVILTVVYLGFLIFCTLYDLIRTRFHSKECKSNMNQTLINFSLVKNTKYLLSTNTDKNEIRFFHGIRAISIICITLGHEYLLQLAGVNSDWTLIINWVTEQYVFLNVAIFSVDTFLAISGFFTAYTFFCNIQKNKVLNIPLYYFNRFIRLNFPILGVILIVPIFTNYIIPSGPYLEKTENLFLKSCRSEWWSILLNLQNFVIKEICCYAHLWYVAVDMQLFWISPLILYPLYKKPKIGFIIIGALIVISMVTTGLIIKTNYYPAIHFDLSLNSTNSIGSIRDIYNMPYTRATPWLFGILLAYITTFNYVKLGKKINCIGWILSFAVFTSCIYFNISFLNVDYKYNLIWELAYGMFSKPLWSLGVCWIIYTNMYENSGLLIKILSSNIFIPISRMSYSIYLTQLMIPLTRIMSSNTSVYPNYFYMIDNMISTLILSFLLAFCFYLMFETPYLVFKRTLSNKKELKSNEKIK